MVKITVCDGPWCGVSSADNVAAFEAELRRLNIADQVQVGTSYCMGSCKHGPCVRINGTKHFHVSMDLIPGLIQKEVLPLLK